MSLIKNLVKEPEKNSKKDENDSDEADKTPRPIIKSATDLQRLKIEKLMKNPDKPVNIPDYVSREARRNREIEPPSFVRNVMGSSAGAGSGEFHVYRHLRRKEYARQKGIQIKSLTEQLDHEYQEKLEENRRIAEEKTAKKREKRLKKKQRAKQIKRAKPNSKVAQHENDHDTTDDEDSKDESEGAKEIEKNVIQATEAEDDKEGEGGQTAVEETAGCAQFNPVNDEQESSQNDALQEDLNKVD